MYMKEYWCKSLNQQILIFIEVLSELNSKDNPLPVGNPAELAKRLGNIAEVSMGGSSGGVSCSFYMCRKI